MNLVDIWVSLGAGFLSFFTPCVLPMVPAYILYMTGTAAGRREDVSRWYTILHAVFFAIGFGLIFVLLGAAAGLLGSLVSQILPYIIRIGGVLLILFGLQMTGLIGIPLLFMEKHLDPTLGDRPSYGRSFLVGIIFAAGWTPCYGPILANILLLAADTQTVLRGAFLLAIYSTGVGLPFILVAAFSELALPLLKKIGKHIRVISIIGGVLLIIMGILFVTNRYTAVTFWLNALLA